MRLYSGGAGKFMIVTVWKTAEGIKPWVTQTGTSVCLVDFSDRNIKGDSSSFR